MGGSLVTKDEDTMRRAHTARSECLAMGRDLIGNGKTERGLEYWAKAAGIELVIDLIEGRR
jgi:hypothetical protein